MSNRRLVVEAAFGFGPLDTLTSTDWVPLFRTDTGATRAMEASWEFGRDTDLDPFPKGTASVLLWNGDRYLDPDYSGSPYAGELLPRVPVRIRSQNTSTLVYTDEFYGFVEGGWEQVLAPVGMTGCRVELSDLLGVLEGYELPDVFEHAVLAQSPVGFWVLDQSGSEQVADLGSGREDGMLAGEGVKLGDKVIAPGHSPAARFDVEIDNTTGQSTFGFVDLGRSPSVVGLSTLTLMVTFQARSNGELNWRTLFSQSNGDNVGRGFHAVVRQTGQLWWARRGGGSTTTQQTSGTVVDGSSHIMFGTSGGSLYLDTSTPVGTAGPAVSMNQTNGKGIGGSYGIQPVDHMDGWIGAAALFGTSMNNSTVQTIIDGYEKLDGLRTDEHIDWALDRVGVPAGLRDLDTGTVFLGPADTKGRDALAWIREVVATEGGEFYVDHRNGGVLRFRHRYARDLETSGNTSQATFSDAPGVAAVIRYSAEGLDLVPNGLDSIVNQMTVQWAGGEITIEDPTSIAAYGPRPRTLQTVATTAAQARSAAEWVVARRKDPASRIRGCVASVRAARAVDDTAHGLEIGDRVTFRVHPTGTARSPVGAATTVALHVEGVRHNLRGVEWETSFRFSSAPTFVPWIWGTGAWNTTAYWG